MKRIALILSIFPLLIQAQTSPDYSDVDIPMRVHATEGIKNLKADVYVPSSGGPQYPVILIQTPYNKNRFRNKPNLPLGLDATDPDYVFVIVDWRGFYNSSGASISGEKRKGDEDGYDVIEWIKNQSWCNGKVGTWGPSALGVVQYETAKAQHPNHICAVPQVAYPMTNYESYYTGGVLNEARLEQLDALGYGLSTLVKNTNFPIAIPPYSVNNYYNNAFYEWADNQSYYPELITIPTLQIGGWYDHNVDGMIRWYKGVKSNAAIPVRDKQWLLFGPWVHGGTGEAYVGSSVQGELNFPEAEGWSDSLAIKFFDFYLRNQTNGWENRPAVTYFQIGDNTWEYASDENFEISNSETLYFNENGSLLSVEGVGSTSFTSDPRTPTPTIGGATLHPTLLQGPYDQKPLVESRNDIILFTTGKLSEDISVTGDININLHIEANQPDCDIAVRLVDEYPDGRSILVTDGIKRMRFRNGYKITDTSFIKLGQVNPITIELPKTAYTWKTDHELKIIISSNNAKKWDVNLNNGDDMYTAGDTNIVSIQVHHSDVYPSNITLNTNNIPSISTSIEEVTPNEGVIISPNPTSDIINITTKTENVFTTIYNSTGKLVLESKNKKLSIAQLRKGVYFARIQIGKKLYSKKIIKI